MKLVSIMTVVKEIEKRKQKNIEEKRRYIAILNRAHAQAAEAESQFEKDLRKKDKI